MDTPTDPRTELAAADAARRAAAAASATPVGATLLVCLLLGVGSGLLAMFEPVGVVTGLLVMLGALVVDARTRRRRGQVTDGRAVTSRMGRYVAIMLVPMFLGQWMIRALDWPLRGVVFGGVMALAAFLYLRLDERYQLRRLAEGGLRPGDIT